MDVVVLGGRLAASLIESLPADLKVDITPITVRGSNAAFRIINRRQHSIINKLDRFLMLPIAAVTFLALIHRWRGESLQNSIDLSDYSINSPEVTSYINSLNPDRVLLIGTEILKSNHSILCPQILNLHSGLVPKYRGLWNWFWPSYFKDFEQNGVTIHQLKNQVDTGEILLQERYTTVEGDSLIVLLNKSLIAQRSILILFFSNSLYQKEVCNFDTGPHLFEPRFSDLVSFRLNRKKQ
jgi:hypothetical protein